MNNKNQINIISYLYINQKFNKILDLFTKCRHKVGSNVSFKLFSYNFSSLILINPFSKMFAFLNPH